MRSFAQDTRSGVKRLKSKVEYFFHQGRGKKSRVIQWLRGKTSRARRSRLCRCVATAVLFDFECGIHVETNASTADRLSSIDSSTLSDVDTASETAWRR